MSDLQISLLVVGVLVVGAVYLFNWLQERRLRRRLEQAFGAEYDDVLLESAPAASTQEHRRVEPQLQPVDRPDAPPAAAPVAAPAAAPAATAAVTAGESLPSLPGFDPAIDFIA